MIVTFLVPDEPRHGVTMYARDLARGLQAAGEEVRVEDVPLGDVRGALRAGWRARHSDVVHLQLADGYWALGRRQLAVAAILRVALIGKRKVLSAHDFHLPHRKMPLRPRGFLAYWRGRKGWYDLTARLLVRSATIVHTCTEKEALHLEWARPRQCTVIPHHVNEPPSAGPHAVQDRTVPRRLVVLGWIHKRKGQHRAVEALAHLPEHHLYLAGAAPARSQDYLEAIEQRAEELGLRERVTITGFLDDEELHELLYSCQIAIAPYERVAASGSIATLLSVGLPVVALDNDYVRSIAAECPRALVLYGEDHPAALASAVTAVTAVDAVADQDRLEEVRRWMQSRSLDSVAAMFQDLYRSISGAASERDKPIATV